MEVPLRPEAIALHDSVSRLDAAFAAVTALGESVPAGARTIAADARAEVARRRARADLVVAVIGEKKTGKSTFLNAVLGDRILGSAAREFTGTVTRIRYGELPDYVAVSTDGSARVFQGPDERATLAAQHAVAQQILDDAEADAAGMEAAVAANESAVHAGELAVRAAQATADHTFSALRVAQGCQMESAQNLSRAEVAIVWLERAIPSWARQPQGRWEALLAWLLVWIWAKPLGTLRGLQQTLDDVRAREQSASHAVSTAAASEQHARAALERARARRDQARLELTFARVSRSESRARLAEAERRLQQAKIAEARWARARRDTLRDELRNLADATRESRTYDRIELKFPGLLLPRDIVLLDTPGVNSTSSFAVERTWLTLRGDADACIVLSDLQQPMSASTQEFVRTVSEIVPYLVLVLTRADRAAASAEPAELEEAITAAARRFGESLGREPGEVAVTAAEPALAAMRARAGDPEPTALPGPEPVGLPARRGPRPGPSTVESFSGVVRALFDGLSRDRVLAQESRIAQHLIAVQDELHGTLLEAGRRAAAREREALAALPESPERAWSAVSGEALRRLHPALDRALAEATLRIDEGVAAMESAWEQEIVALLTQEQADAWVRERPAIVVKQAAKLRSDGLATLSSHIGALIHDAEHRLQERLSASLAEENPLEVIVSAGLLVPIAGPTAPGTTPNTLGAAARVGAVVEGVFDALAGLWVTPERRRSRAREQSTPLLTALRAELRGELLGRSASLRVDVRRLLQARLHALLQRYEPAIRERASRLAANAAAAAGAAEAIDAARRELLAASDTVRASLDAAAAVNHHLARSRRIAG